MIANVKPRPPRFLPRKDHWPQLFSAAPLQRGRPPHLRKIKTPMIRLETSWDPDSVLDARDEHLRGQLQRSGMLHVWMLCTSRYKVCVLKRTGALSAIPPTVTPTRDIKIASPEEKAVAKLWESRWPVIMPEATRQELQRQALGLGVALARVMWIEDERGRWWPTLTKWADDAFYYSDTDCCWYARTREGADKKIRPGKGWLLWLPHGPMGFQLGSVTSLGIECLMSSLSKTDWANYNKANATAVKKAIVPRGLTQAEKDLFLDNVEEVGEGENSTVLCQQNVDKSGTDFSYETTGDGKTDTFERAKADAEKTITIEVLGQEKTTDDGGVGTYDAVEALQHVEDRLVVGDGESLSEAIYWQLAVPWAVYNFGRPEWAPWVRWQPKKAVDGKAVAEEITAVEGVLQGTDKQLDKLTMLEEAGFKMIQRPPSQVPETSNALDIFQSEGLLGSLIAVVAEARAAGLTDVSINLEDILKQRGVPFTKVPLPPTPAPEPAPERGREPLLPTSQ